MALFVFSKSSIYEALPWLWEFAPVKSFANSAVKLIEEGMVMLINGILSIRSVSHWLFCFHDRLSPIMVLLKGSLPIATLDVSDCSVRCINVPPKIKFLLKSYCQFKPSMVLRSKLSPVLSRLTLTAVPASMMLWLRIVTSPVP